MTDKLDKSKLFNKEKDSFFYGPGMQKNWVVVNQMFLDYVGSKHSQSAKASVVARRLVVTEVDKTVLKKFKTKEEQTKFLDSLDFWQQEEHTTVRKITRSLVG